MTIPKEETTDSEAQGDENAMIYMDNAATTRISTRVLGAMMPYLTENYGNPSSVYELGMKSYTAISTARKQIADSIGAEPNEIFFTSGGTESDNWAIKGTCETFLLHRGETPHIISSVVEHHAVLEPCHHVGKMYGVHSTFIGVDREGIVDVEQLEQSIQPNTKLISVMMANNEIGTIQPIKEIGEIARKNHIIFHVDAVQAYGQIPIDVKRLGIDMMSVSGHKVHAPKGTGFLYVRKGSLPIEKLMHGGGQERAKRAGTENVPGIAGLGMAAEQITDNFSAGDIKNKEIAKMRDHIIHRLLDEVDGVRVNGSMIHRLPNNISLLFDNVVGETLVLALSLRGICVSSGSACTSGSLDPSHVLTAIGRTDEEAHEALRITLSMYNTMEEADIVVDAIKEEVQRLRRFC